ncbi:hypothetical protein B0H67DRAFT_562732 [Lasiosphaeris hirsuta]|uniref:Secreted protein n=1 Tax=Lasiosphaeris hirsuta TaxID=260670 RepID=A0AA40BAK9_9PEZI|nr:hypothetical protein B0H67DRAFT_562732 [Lasiosphaeris hirsuta]
MKQWMREKPCALPPVALLVPLGQVLYLRASTSSPIPCASPLVPCNWHTRQTTSSCREATSVGRTLHWLISGVFCISNTVAHYFLVVLRWKPLQQAPRVAPHSRFPGRFSVWDSLSSSHAYPKVSPNIDIGNILVSQVGEHEFFARCTTRQTVAVARGVLFAGIYKRGPKRTTMER